MMKLDRVIEKVGDKTRIKVCSVCGMVKRRYADGDGWYCWKPRDKVPLLVADIEHWENLHEGRFTVSGN